MFKKCCSSTGTEGTNIVRNAMKYTKRVQKLLAENPTTLEKAKLLARLAPETAIVKSTALSRNEANSIIDSVPKEETKKMNRYLSVMNAVLDEDYRVAYTAARVCHFFHLLALNTSNLSDYLVRLDTMNKLAAQSPEEFKPVILKAAKDEADTMGTLGFDVVDDEGTLKLNGYLLRKVILMDRTPYIAYLSQGKTLRAQLYEFLDKYGDRDLIPEITKACINELENTEYQDYEPHTRAFWQQHIIKPDDAPDGDPEESIYIDEYLGMPKLFPSIESEEIKITKEYLGAKENVFIKTLTHYEI